MMKEHGQSDYALDKDGRETSKITVPDGSTVVVEDGRKKVEFKPSETGRADLPSRSNPVTAASEAGSPPVVRPAVLSNDPLQPGTT